MTFSATWIDLEIVILCEVVRQKEEILYDIPYIRNDTNKLIYKADTHSQTEKMNLWLLEGKDGGKDSSYV